MVRVNLHEAKMHLSRLVERALLGEEVIIARGGRPAVRIVPAAVVRAPRRPGSVVGQLKVAEDFHEPLPPAVIEESE